ncbi:MAG: non-homologous end-joining DNA ligase [Thermoleophilia bacterium]
MAASETTIRAGRRRIRLTNPDKLLFPADGITKRDLAEYYAAVERPMRTHIQDRPLNVWRWNAGIDRDVVVQQEMPRGLPGWVRSVEVRRRGRGGTVRHAVGGAQVCVALAQLNCVTPHAWAGRADRVERPDRIIFDLDPPDEDPDAHWPAVVAGARATGDVLRELGLTPFAKTSGSRGLHVVAPIRRGRDADDVRAVAGAIAELVAARRPDTLTTAWRKAGRGGRILVDVARNTYSQTTVAPYAVRALPGAPVATPIAWDELDDPRLHPRRWTLATVPARLGEVGDPWADIDSAARALPRLD